MSDANKLAHGLLRCFLTTAARDRAAAISAADVALERFAPDMPECAPLFTGITEEAEWWADGASDTMIATVLRACLRRVTRRNMVSPKARKMALVAIWNTLDEHDRTAFLEMVDPGPGARE